MLRCLNDTHSIMGLALSQISLYLATGILLIIVISFVFSNDWQRTAELQSQANSFSNVLGDVENNFFDRIIRFQFSQKEYPYFARISTEYIVLSAKGSWDNTLTVTQRFLIKPWPRLPSQNWTTGEDLHTYLNKSCGYRGTENDPISMGNFTQLSQEQNNSSAFFALHPLEIRMNDLVYVEKVTIYYDQGKHHDFLLVYQP